MHYHHQSSHCFLYCFGISLCATGCDKKTIQEKNSETVAPQQRLSVLPSENGHRDLGIFPTALLFYHLIRHIHIPYLHIVLLAVRLTRLSKTPVYTMRHAPRHLLFPHRSKEWATAPKSTENSIIDWHSSCFQPAPCKNCERPFCLPLTSSPFRRHHFFDFKSRFCPFLLGST